MQEFKIGCHVSIAGGVWKAPKNAADLACETFQIFTRPPMGGPAPKLDTPTLEKFKTEMEKYFPSAQPHPTSPLEKGRRQQASSSLSSFVVHCPYFVNFGSGQKRIFHGSVSVVRQELERSTLLGAKFVMTHLGSFKDLGPKKGMAQVKEGLKQVLDGYKGTAEFLLEISAGAGEIIGDTFEELAEIMEPVKKHKGFGGICFDTQHAFASGYNVSSSEWVKKFNNTVGLEYLRMSHINDSKTPLGSHRDRHEHIGEGEIGEGGIGGFMVEIQHHFDLINNLSTRHKGGSLLSSKGETNKVLRSARSFPLILETEHDKVEKDIKILKKLRDKINK